MHKLLTVFISFTIGFGLIVLEQTKLIESGTPVASLFSVIAYSMLGSSILFIAYKLIDWIIPADIEAEIFDKQYLAAAVFKGTFLLAVAIIIAAVILTP